MEAWRRSFAVSERGSVRLRLCVALVTSVGIGSDAGGTSYVMQATPCP